MKLLSIIGTRPQYIKLKPFYDYCKKNNIEHKIVDTLQHYSHSVSGVFIEEFGYNIDYSINANNKDEIGFISSSLLKIEKILKIERPSVVLVYGDTNSTFSASLVAFKLGYPVVHIEAGVRGGNLIPEEVNRIFTDTVSSINFCSSKENLHNIERGVFSGDLEYELLQNINPKISYDDFAIMTLHRQSNTNKKRLNKIFNFCKNLDIKIKFFIHHRTRAAISEFRAEIPENIEALEPCSYRDMVNYMASCKYIVTDSGSIQKTSPFFGKKALIMREEGLEWKETLALGFAKNCAYTESDKLWLSSFKVNRNANLYANKDGVSKTIINHLLASYKES